MKKKFNLSLLNEKEKTYFKLVYPQSGVLFLTSEPGIGKSAIFRSISKKLGLEYFDIRLAMLDETDVGLYPDKVEFIYEVTDKDGNVNKFSEKMLKHIVPEWAVLANKQPSMIHFEELNRAPLAVRNAALQILLERGIGFKFKFNENVFMCASGNLGDEDGCDVEEFDAALNGRLLHYKHSLSLKEWMDYFANENIHKTILNFLIAHEDHYYISKDRREQNSKSYASPRAWTFLSDYIVSHYGMDSRIEDWVNDIEFVGHSHVGPSNVAFVRYCRDFLKLSIQNILESYDKIKEDYAEKKITLLRDKKSELISDLKRLNFRDFKNHQKENLKLFLLDCSDDEVVGYLLKLLDEDYHYDEDKEKDFLENEAILKFLKDPRFTPYELAIKKHVDTEEEEKEDA
ncbi:MAG: hypothetical protein WC755_08250 [Candidatus Woesearchaeota archaeon]|jgi:hypothetical protein